MSENITINLEGLSKEEREQLLGLVEEAKKPKKIWKPKCGEWYWFVGSDGEVDSCEWENDRIDRGRYSMGNCFRTKEEAIFVSIKQTVKTELQRYADEHNDPNLEEWNVKNWHYYIEYLPKCDALEIVSMCSRRMESVTYFTSENIAEDARKEIGEKRIMKYLFDVDCEVDE